MVIGFRISLDSHSRSFLSPCGHFQKRKISLQDVQVFKFRRNNPEGGGGDMESGRRNGKSQRQFLHSRQNEHLIQSSPQTSFCFASDAGQVISSNSKPDESSRVFSFSPTYDNQTLSCTCNLNSRLFVLRELCVCVVNKEENKN